MLDNKEDLLTCQCGSIFFDEIKAKTYLSTRFVFYGDATRSQLQVEDVTIPVAKCLFCGKIHIPGTSFSGMNQLNRSVQCYGELIEQQNKHTRTIEKIAEVASVKAEPNSEVNTKDAVRTGATRGKSSKNNKEQVS